MERFKIYKIEFVHNGTWLFCEIKKLLDCVWKLVVSEILDDRYYSFCEYNMDDMGIYLETPEKKQEIMQKKLWAW